MAILTWAQQPLATIGTIRGRLEDAHLLIKESKDSDRISSIISQCQIDAKNELRKHLINWARETIPDRLDAWLNLRQSQLQSYHERQNLDMIPPFVGGGLVSDSNVWVIANGGFAGIQNVDEASNPTTYYISGAPVNGTKPNGTLVGEATNGDALVDVSTRKFYINRGTAFDAATPSVTWDRFNHKGALDHIANPEELIEAHLCETIRRMCQKGSFRDRPGTMDPNNHGYYMSSHTYWRSEFLANLYGDRDPVTGRTINPGTLRALDIDFSGDGDISDFERSIAGEEHWGIQ